MLDFVPFVMLLCFMSVISLLVAPCNAAAKTSRVIRNAALVEDSICPLSVWLNAGLINGKSHELVYEVGGSPKISELIWRLEDVPMIGLSVLLILPRDTTLNLAGWTKGNTKMKAPDGDEYFYKGAGIAHYSWMTAISVDYRF